MLDDLDRARSHGDLESGPLKSVADKLATALEGLGLSGFGAEGDEFDPALHEAVQHEGDGHTSRGRHRDAAGLQARRPGAAARHGRGGRHRARRRSAADTPDNGDEPAEQAAESE